MRRPAPRLAATAAAFAALAATAVAPPTSEATGALVFTGDGATWTEFVVASETSFAYADAVISGDGRYAGVVIRSATGRSYGGVVAAPELGEPVLPLPAEPRTVFAGATTRLPPGRYRAYLLAEGRAQVTLRLYGGAAQVVRATRPSRQAYSVSRRSLDPARGTGALRLPLAVRGTTRTYVVGRISGATADHRLRACVTPTRRACGGGVVNEAPAFTTGQSGLGLPASAVPRHSDARVEVAFGRAQAPAVVPPTLALLVLQLDL